MANSRYTTRLSPILKNKTVVSYSPTVFSLITIIIFIIFAIRPTVKTIISLRQTIDNQNKILSQLQQKSQALATAINNYNAIPDDTKIKLLTLLPNATNVTCLLSDLTNTSNSSTTTIIGIQIQPVEINKPAKCLLDSGDLAADRQSASASATLRELGFSINNQADFAQLSNFLYSFNSSTRLINIESATFNKQPDSPLGLVIIGKAFFYK